LGLNEHINNIIEPLIKTDLVDKKITLEKYLINKKIPANKINGAISLINNIVNNNCMISSLIEYDIKGTTLLYDIVSSWNMDNLRNNMMCVINDKVVIDDLIKQLLLVIISPRIELCNKDRFKNYCETSYQNYLKEISPKVKVITEVKPVLSPKIVTKPVLSPKVETKPVLPPKIVTKPVLPPKIVTKPVLSPKIVTKPVLSPKLETKPVVKVEVVNKKQLEKFTQMLDKTKKEIQTGSLQILNMESKILPLVSSSPKYMDIHSLSEHLQKFNVKSFGTVLEPSMIKIMSIFKQNNKKDFNILDKKEFGKLVVILVDQIKLVVNKIVDEDDFSKLKPFIEEFNNLQKIFYLLKHNYKLLLAYELINTKIIKIDERLQAQLCCSKTNEKSCFNFSANPKNSSGIIYGFNELGFVESVKCIKDDEAGKKLDLEQNMTIDELFNQKYAAWRNLTKENKLKILASVINYFKMFGVKLNKIDGKIIDIRKQMEENKNKITMNDFNLNIPIKAGNINQKFIVNNNNFKNIVEQIKKIDKIDKLNEMIKSLGYHEYISFNNSVDIVYAKNILETLVPGSTIYDGSLGLT
jgi:hypothetical protein